LNRQYRYETLLAIGSPLDIELKLMDELAVKHLKTYQVWHHRRLLLMITRKPGPELGFVEASLKVDVKNYHTWSYRQWLLAYFNDEDLWGGELDFVDMMLVQDVRNNSAWHHRFFVVFQSGVRRGEEDRGRVIRRELTYVLFNGLVRTSILTDWSHLDMSSKAFLWLQTTYPLGIIFVVSSM
jgi:protein farnesyltransferase/geranylgeranyltransferase type-1 subunit alpha